MNVPDVLINEGFHQYDVAEFHEILTLIRHAFPRNGEDHGHLKVFLNDVGPADHGPQQVSALITPQFGG